MSTAAPASPSPSEPASASPEPPPSGLVAVLFTDVVGSTALKQQLGDRGSVALLTEHHALVRQTLSRFPGGQEIETAGDSFLIVFTAPSAAVQFALELQVGLKRLAQTSGVAVRDRIGIHVGEVVMRPDARGVKPRELYGMQVDICARVMSLASGGQILMTRFAFDNARQILRGQGLEDAGPVQWLNHGPYLFKGLEEPLEVCEVRVGGGELAPPPPSTEKARRYGEPGEEWVLGWRPAVGQTIPTTQWMLEGKLGEGGFGEVWQGRHSRLKELRVFKFCFRANRVRALKREMTLFRLLKGRVGEHPNIVRLLEVNLDSPPFYLEEEYLAGRDLRSWCEGQGGVEQVPFETRLEIVAQAAEGLAAAHAAGIIHRDVKPGNILIAECGVRNAELHRGPSSAIAAYGMRNAELNLKSEIADLKSKSAGCGAGSAPSSPQPPASGPPGAGLNRKSQIANLKPNILAKLTDFGVGQVVSAEYLAGVTATGFTGTIVRSTSSSQSGTHAYMAPEVLVGRAASAQSDLYSLGVVLYQLVVGDFARPVTADWRDDITDELLREDLRHCLAGKVEERFVTAGELARNLRSLAERRAARVAAEQEAFERGVARVASLAVLPFVNMSPDPENEFLSDGIAEDLLTALSRVPGLRVPGRTSCFAFKGKTDDLRKIGQMLSVETVLEGSVRKAGHRLRISAQLINVTNGFHLWSERYDREMADVFAIQDDIAQAIVGALMPKLGTSQPVIRAKAAPGNIEAYELCLRGRYYTQKLTPDGFAMAIQHFEQALERDPDLALAHSGLATVYAQLSYFGGGPPAQVQPKVKAAAERAIELDGTLADAHTILGNLLYFFDWNWAGAEREFQRALALEPQSAEAHMWYGFFLWARLRHEPALVELDKAVDLDPLSPPVISRRCWPLLSLGRYDEVRDLGRRMLAMEPDFWPGHMASAFAKWAKGLHAEAIEDWKKAVTIERGPVTLAGLGYMFAHAGRLGEAELVLEQIQRMAQTRYVQPTCLARAYLAVGDKEQGLACLQRAIAERDPALVHLRGWAQWFPGMLADCLELLEKIGL